jgi:hypothetical protein
VLSLVLAVVLGCTPHPGLGSVTFERGNVQHVLDLGTCRDRVIKKPRRAAGVVSPDGRYKATVRRTGSRQTLRDTIVVNGRPIYSAKVSGDTSGLNSPGPIGLLRWSGNDRWIFFTTDPGGSASIAADGLILRVISRSGGQVHPLGTMLPYPDYLTWCGGKLVFTAGADRIATHHKQLLVASAPAWKPRPLVRVPGQAWGSLTCSPNSRSLVAQSQPESNNAKFFSTRWSLWGVGLDGSHGILDAPPAGWADESPRWSRDGRSLLFVRERRGRGGLWLWRGGRATGPIASLGYSLGYYGHHDWPFAWLD